MEAAGQRRPELILTVGLPRSGKTTWAKLQELPIVNPDSIRMALHGQRFAAHAEAMVWAIATIMVRSLFLAGHYCVIVDATNISRKRRDAWMSKDWDVTFQPFDADPQTCIERARSIGDEEIVPVIERMAKEYQPVEDDEGGFLRG